MLKVLANEKKYLLVYQGKYRHELTAQSPNLKTHWRLANNVERLMYGTTTDESSNYFSPAKQTC